MRLAATIFLTFALLFLAACAPYRSYTLDYELRAPKTQVCAPSIRIDFVTESSAGGTNLKWVKRSEDEKYRTYSSRTFIHTGEKRRALFVDVAGDPKYVQVFYLTIPKNPAPIGWTQWSPPNFLGRNSNPDPMWGFMHGTDEPYRIPITEPLGLFELRYKVTAE